MKLRCSCRLGALLVAICLLPGCAPAYHAYPKGRVTCGYRLQPALPFTFYRGCPTPSPSGRQANAVNAEFNALCERENANETISDAAPSVQPYMQQRAYIPHVLRLRFAARK